jgi:hypothetical protein
MADAAQASSSRGTLQAQSAKVCCGCSIQPGVETQTDTHPPGEVQVGREVAGGQLPGLQQRQGGGAEVVGVPRALDGPCIDVCMGMELLF